MKGTRLATGSVAAFVIACAIFVVPALADSNSPNPKDAGDHVAYTYCHRTGSESNSYIVITTDDAGWADAHQTGSTPAPPPKLTDNDDILIGIDLDPKKFDDKKLTKEECLKLAIEPPKDGGGK